MLIGAVALLLVLFVAWGIRGIMGLVEGSAQSGSETAAVSTSAEQSGDQTKVVSIGNGLSQVVIDSCTPQDLMATVQVPSGIYLGTGATFTVTLSATGNAQCSTSTEKMSLKITSGGQTINDTAACSAQSGAAQSGTILAEQTPLLFAPGDSWTGTMVWDGRAYSNCQPADVSGSGTYQVQILMDGQALSDPVPFTVN